VRRCSVRAMYLSTSALAGKPNRGTITSVRPLPLPIVQFVLVNNGQTGCSLSLLLVFAFQLF